MSLAFTALATEMDDENVALHRAREHMVAHLHGPVLLDQLARAAGMGKFRFASLFTRHLGCPPHRYLMHLRVAYAKELLAQGERPGKVAYEAGFCDQSHLNRWFRRLVGSSPGAFRERCCEAAGTHDGRASILWSNGSDAGAYPLIHAHAEVAARSCCTDVLHSGRALPVAPLT
jgi:AraC-like DNA-binding protein